MYVNGGSAFNQTQSCANGAAGTIYHALKDELTIDTSIRSELFNCVPKNSLKTLLNQKEFISAYNTQFKVNVTTV